MNRRYIIILITLITHTNICISQVKDVDISCLCFNGVGSAENDTPVITFDFSNKQKVSICGFWDHETHDSYNSTPGFIISEFNIFNCETGYSYVEFGAQET